MLSKGLSLTLDLRERLLTVKGRRDVVSLMRQNRAEYLI